MNQTAQREAALQGDTLREALEPLLFDLFDLASQIQDSGAPTTIRAYREHVGLLQSAAKQRRLHGLSYVGMLVHSGLARLAMQGREAREDERAALSAWPALVLSELMSPADADSAAVWSVLHELRRFDWFPSVPADYVELIERRLSEDHQRLAPADAPQIEAGLPAAAASSEQADRSDAVDEQGAAPAAAENAVTQEELVMLGEALAGLRDDLSAVLAQELSQEVFAAALEGHIEQLQNLINAANLVGLWGLQQAIEAVLVNVAALQAADELPNEVQQVLLQQWPNVAMAYLQSPGDQAMARSLIECVSNVAWPYPADTSDADVLAAWLVSLSSVIVMRSRTLNERPAQALLEHVDISVPPDIDRKVLDSLLQELPPHAQDFSALVQRLAQGAPDCTLDDMEQARRVAHTLKGAANTVGIKGVANLTHALEDILVAYGRESRLPSEAVCATMLEAADCLEAMSETLVSGGSAPPDSLAVYQKVLNWANQIDHDGLPDGVALAHAPLDAAASQATAPASAPAPSEVAAPLPDEEAAETYLRVPASLIDSLLKLAGENSILTSQIQDRIKHLGENINALRTGSRQFGQLSSELEQLVDVRGLAMLGGNTGELDALEMDQYNELHMLSRRIVESGADGREISRAFEREIIGLRDLVAEKERMQMEIQRAIQRARMVEVATVAPRLQRTVRQAARVLGRSVNLQIVGEHTMVDTQLLDRIIDPLMHLLRNAVDHGIEPSDMRAAKGKTEVGTITLSFRTQGNNVAVRCEDDGAGLDLRAIRHRAAAVGLIQPDAELSEAQVMRLILLPGFSTRTQTTQISGRGIGMDVVQRAVLDLRGTLEMTSNPGAGSCFDMNFPVSMSTQQVMLTRSDQHLLAISVRGVDQILPAREEVEVAQDGSMTYLMQGERLPAMRIESLMGLPIHALQKPGVIEVAMIIHDQFRQRLAIIVPELIEARTVVVKPFNAVMSRILGVDGATILGDGSVASVIDLPDLVRGCNRAELGDFSGADAVQRAKLPLCLVVDDSVSVRRTMEQLMHDSGYEVVTARDGVDALGVVQNCAPDIVLVDLEMPRMNGLELTSALRNRDATKATPVVMITSRFTDKHRQLASDAGVNAFLTKPYSEDLLLNTMDGLLRTAA